MSPTPIRLLLNDSTNPVGVAERPYFGWHILDARSNQVQTRYQLLVASSRAVLATAVGDMWDSGQVTGDKQSHVVYQGRPLQSNKRYYWSVRIWDSALQPGPYAELAYFTTGLLAQDDWAGAQWIKRDNDDPDDYTYYRNRFSLPADPIHQAIAYVTAVHKYELYLNGRRLGAGPAYQYPQYQYYNAYDISDHLTPDADNLLAVFTHWFGGGQGRPASQRGLLLKVIVDYANGRSLTIGSDGSWRCRQADCWLPDQPPRHPQEGVGYLEAIDAARLIPDWHTLQYDDADWRPVTVIGPQPTPPWTGRLRSDLTRIVEYPIKPATIRDKGDGRYLVDLGQVYAGRPQIRFGGGEAGVPITLQGGYALNENDTINQKHNQGTDLRYFAIDNGGEFTFLPQEYLGMRYFSVDNSPMPITVDNFTFIVRHAELDRGRSHFSSSNEILNQVWEFLKRSILVGAQEQFLDTPTREKGGFLVDGLNESLAAMAAFGERSLTRRVLHEFLDSMEQYWSSEADWGRLNAVYPNGDGARDIPDFTQAYLVWAWRYYVHTGDKAFLRDNYAKLKAVADYVHRHRDGTTGLIHKLSGGGDGPYRYGIIDWPPMMRYSYDMTAVARTVISAYAYADYDIIAKIAAELGEKADQRHYRALAHEMKTAVNRHLLNPHNIYCDGLLENGAQSSHASQQANMLPLALGIVPADKQANVLQHVKDLKISVGMPTVYWLIRALGQMGAGEHLLDLYTRTDWDGWAKNISQGATCTWESWDANTGGDLSMSHPWGAVGLIGIQEYILGVQPLAPQFAQLQIKPLWFGAKLTYASGKVPTERGDISVSWRRKENGHYTLSLTLPSNTKASIYLPVGENEYSFIGDFGSGRHTFT